MSSKAEKLAAARKKLKEYQSKSKNECNLNKLEEKRDSESQNIETRSGSNLSLRSNSPEESLSQDSSSLNPTPLFNEYFGNDNCEQQQQWERRDTLPIGELSSTVKPFSENKDTELLGNLQIQIQNQSQTIGILVSERNDLQRQLTNLQLVLASTQRDRDELNGKYVNSMGWLRELNECKQQFEELIRERDNFKKDLFNERWKCESVLKDQLRLEEELSELKQVIHVKNEDRVKVEYLQNQLALTELKLQQLGDSAKGTNTQDDELKQQVQHLQSELSVAQLDKQKLFMFQQQISSHVTDLENQVDKLKQENENLLQQNELLRTEISTNQSNIKNLNEKIVEVEGKNSEEDKNQSLLAELENLKKVVSEKEGERVRLASVVEELSAALSSVKEELHREHEREQRRMREEEQSAVATVAAMESDKVAAARALQQNITLKQQLTEMEHAFIKLSDEKVQFMDRLSTEEHKTKQLTERVDELMKQLDHDNNIVGDDSDLIDIDIDTLRSIVIQLRKDKQALINRQHHNHNLHQHNEQDHHDHDHDHNHDHIHDHDHEHNHDHDHDHEHNHDHNHDHEGAHKVEELNQIISQLQNDKAALIARLRENSTNEIDKDPLVLDAMERKLRSTMDAVAALDEEKNRLEHLVMQLQGETETIGDYISLYQEQRRLMKERTKEKDEQMQQLKMQLTTLDQLVKKLIQKNNTTTSSEKGDSSQLKLEDELSKEEDHEKSFTVEKIKDLINEIEATSLNGKVGEHAFQHCPCCSGRLINI